MTKKNSSKRDKNLTMQIYDQLVSDYGKMRKLADRIKDANSMEIIEEMLSAHDDLTVTLWQEICPSRDPEILQEVANFVRNKSVCHPPPERSQ